MNANNDTTKFNWDHAIVESMTEAGLHYDSVQARALLDLHERVRVLEAASKGLIPASVADEEVARCNIAEKRLRDLQSRVVQFVEWAKEQYTNIHLDKEYDVDGLAIGMIARLHMFGLMKDRDFNG